MNTVGTPRKKSTWRALFMRHVLFTLLLMLNVLHLYGMQHVIILKPLPDLELWFVYINPFSYLIAKNPTPVDSKMQYVLGV